MRSIKLAGALAAAATLLCSVAPGASIAAGARAAKHPRANGRCDVNVNVAPRVITSGDAVVVFGRLHCRGRGQPSGGAGATTGKLLQHSVGTPGFTVVQTTTTDARGFYEFTVPAVQFNSVFFVRSHGATSGRKGVKVAAQATLTG